MWGYIGTQVFTILLRVLTSGTSLSYRINYSKRETIKDMG